MTTKVVVVPVLTDFVKAYDVRGLVPEQLSPDVARALGIAFAEVVAIPDGKDRIVIGHDMRPSSPDLSAAFADGVTGRGVDVTLIGLCSTDGLYYASGALDVPGAMFTASHNPARYNGIKLCRAAAKPVGQDTGLPELRDLAQWLLDGRSGLPAARTPPGTIEVRDMLGEYSAFLRGLVDLSDSRPLKLVVDAGNGMSGLTVPAVLGTAAGLPPLPLEIVPLYFELDGSFPNHEANPLDPANLVDLQAAVRVHGADVGLAFDGDADRCFVVDADGEPVSPSAITGLVAAREIGRARSAGEHDVAIVHNAISSAAVAEVVREHGGTPIRTRVGHSFIKEEMARTGAVFGGEHSAHYYFRDFWFADTGMLAALHVLAALGEQDRPLAEIAHAYERYASSGEINSTVEDQASAVDRVRAWAVARDASIDELDGLTVAAPESESEDEDEDEVWWFNVRASNTEPLLRLNVEASDRETMTRIRDEVLGLIRGATVPAGDVKERRE
ncbi:MAG TPA: phosphomannomutase/phosphoglucomutase [Intrasporangium sp.]|uniref:phosphomannomutase/phosphoglucomutase n=1 Tax=Intrasporangium sp. TaxID=1925024 RepID=UPI002B47FDCA|nr:phosphomannomutase/phosphoglucomutase [Intrasporangium sp.]HKX68656.1 phosphomannomutase/phosphoglucomutase [Intrasporangium sp.]